MTTDRTKLLRAVVDAAIAYVTDDSGEPDTSGLDASERLSEALSTLADASVDVASNRALRELSPAERAVVRAAWCGCCGDGIDGPLGTERAGLDAAVARLVRERKAGAA